MVFIFIALSSIALDNGIGLTPALGWRSYNAFGGRPTQAIMDDMLTMMVDRPRSVNGKPTSLLDLGYNRFGLDGGWNFCFPENNTFHLKDGTPVWNELFPDPAGLVQRAHANGLLPGWYLNNCGCAEHAFSGEDVEVMMKGSVRMLAEQGWDGVKFDSCSQFHNLTRWAELINATGRKVLIENCHQGGFTPGMRQWQGYVKGTNASGSYKHFLGLFYGLASATVLTNVTFNDCRAHCDSLQTGCGGFCFAAEHPAPQSVLTQCYLSRSATPNHMDMSNANFCTGASDPSDCPYHMYRVSGDISASWHSMLANLEYTTPFLGEGGVHPPYPQDHTVRSRPGGFAYPDMLEVGNLANATEDRSHFAAWVVVSSPLILSFNLSDASRMDRVWPFISNRALLVRGPDGT